MNIKLNSNEVNVIRDVALALENTDKQISCDLMAIALESRPNGSFIHKKYKEYTSITKPSQDKYQSIALALQHLEDNIPLLLSLLPIANNIMPANQLVVDKIENYLPISQIYTVLKYDIEQLKKNNDLLRNKVNQLHKGLCYSDIWKVKEIDDPAGKVSPVELIDKKSDITVIVFSGMATSLSMPPKEFFRSLTNKNINLLFVKDFQQCWYQNGLMGLTQDIQSTVVYLKNLIPDNTKYLTCMGTSAGGYAAIRIGTALNADRVIAFSPQTNITKGIFERFRSQDSRINEIDFNETELDLNSYLSNQNITSKLEVHFGKENEKDADAAVNIKDFAELYPYDTSMHSIASYMKKQGLLLSLFDSITDAYGS